MSPSLVNPSLPIPHPTKPSNFKKLGLGFFSPIPIRRRDRIHRNSIACEKKDDGFYMRRCVELARTAIVLTSWNPMVGCVIIDDGGEIVGEGFHPIDGQPHAEVFALRNAGSLAESATAYVNHVGMVDPSPIVALKGNRNAICDS